jgi:hypothetical protein
MRRFYLNRTEDESGVSGTGRVADGVLFENGMYAVAFRSLHKGVIVYPSLAEMMVVHGHEGRTEVVWIDDDPKAPKAAEKASEEEPPPADET